MPTKKYKKQDGKRVPGTTTVIDSSLGWGREGLMWWAWKQGSEGKEYREERDKAAEAGTIAHAMAESDVKGLLLPVRQPGTSDAIWEAAYSAFEAYQNWKEMSRVKIVAAEISFVSEEYRFGGTLDGIGEFTSGKGSRLELIDFKTSNDTHENHIIQLAAYKHLFEEGNLFESDFQLPGNRKIAGIHLLRFSKVGGDFHHSYYAASRMEKPWYTFTLLRQLYDLKKDIEGML